MAAAIVRRFLTALLLLLVAGVDTPVRAEGDLSSVPILRVETGVHGARINRLVLDPAQSHVITVADDKTARVWSLADGTLLYTLRIPIGDGPEGRIHAVAISPNGKKIVVGGFTGLTWFGSAKLYVFNPLTGGWLGNIGFGQGGTAPVRDLAFLSDDRLLVALDDNKGLRVVDFAAKRIITVADDLNAPVMSIDVAADGRVVASAQDGSVRLYDSALQRLAKVPMAAGVTPYKVAFSPDASLVAVGLTGGPRPQAMLLSAKDLKPVKELSGGEKQRGALALVGWSADGEVLYGAGSYGKDGGARFIRRWPIKQPGSASDLSLGERDIVTDLRGLPGGGVLFATADPAWGTIEGDGRSRLLRERRQADFRDGFDGCFAVSATGDVVDFGLKQGGRECVRFDVTKSRLEHQPGPRTGLSRPQVSAKTVTVTDWRNKPRPQINGKPVSLDPNELARSVAVATDASGVAIGSDFAVRFFKDGVISWKTETSSPAWMVATTSDDRYVVAGLGDGSIRWLSRATGEIIVSLLVVPHEDSWVLWTPEGLYDYGGSGEALIGYHRNRVEHGQPAGVDFVEVGQVYSSYYRRDLVKRKFRGEAGTSIAAYIDHIGGASKILDRGLPPLLTLTAYCVDEHAGRQCQTFPQGTTSRGARLTDAPAVSVDAPMITLRVQTEDRGGGFGDIQVLRDNVPVPTAAGGRTTGDQNRARSDDYVVQLAPGKNEFVLKATNGAGEIESSPDEQIHFSVMNTATPAAGKPTLRLIAIGVNRFASPELTRDHELKYAVADARGVIEMMQSDQSRGVYDKVDAILLTDEQATLSNIKKAFDDIAARSQPDDVGLLFLAGHGVNIDGKYNFLPYDLRDLTLQGIRESALTHEELARLLRSLQTTRMLVAIDSYFSDNFDQDMTETAAGQLVKSGGRVILAGATSEQEARKGTTSGHGIFTSVLLDALSGKADQETGNRDRQVDVLEVSTYSLDRFPQAAERSGYYRPQQPVFKASTGDDFALREMN
ncbi:MAG: caspase family protein [Rhodospirillales bacterium]|nr:caspase family protein [Rhodospirillales bacterium]